KNGFRPRDVPDRLTGNRIGQEADKITGMASLERNPDFTVRFEPADAWPMSGTRIDHDERSASWVDFNALRRNDADKRIVDGTRKGATVDNEFNLVFQHMRRGLGEVLTVGVAPLAHDIPEQNAALGRVDHVCGRCTEQAEGR